LLRSSGVAALAAVEPLAHRREAAASYGADQVTNPATGLNGYGADVAFEVAGNDDAVRLAMESVRPGGRVVLAGIPGDDTTTFTASLARRKGLTIAMVRRMNDVYPRAISLAARGAVALDPLVSRRADLGAVVGAFVAAQRRTGLKVLVNP
jgi:L-iditol 2-dehydrogenase